MSATSTVNASSANMLIFGAGTVSTFINGAGIGFTGRVIPAPDGDFVEDRIASGAGSYSASAPMAGGSWMMKLVAFRGMSPNADKPIFVRYFTTA